MANIMGHVKDVMSDKFTWKDGVGSVEASEMPAGLFTSIYEDACDGGFIVTSKRTGRKILFTIAEEKTDGEGDICFWRLTAQAEVKTTGGFRRFDKHIYEEDLGGQPRPSIIIFND